MGVNSMWSSYTKKCVCVDRIMPDRYTNKLCTVSIGYKIMKAGDQAFFSDTIEKFQAV